MDYGLKDARALVTGSSRGIGLATAKVLAREGAQVALCGRSNEALDAAVAQIEQGGGRAWAVPCDLADPEAAGALVKRAEEALGGGLQIAVLCHASLTPMAKVHSLQPQAVQDALGADLQSSFGLLREAMPSLMAQRFGRIVVVSSASAQLGQGGAPLYSAIKAGLEGLVRNLAIDFGRFNITANAVAPGFVNSERLRQRADAAQQKGLAQATSLRRLAEPEEVAEAICFLCSTAASYVSGIVLPVTGGAHLMNLW